MCGPMMVKYFIPWGGDAYGMSRVTCKKGSYKVIACGRNKSEINMINIYDS